MKYLIFILLSVSLSAAIINVPVDQGTIQLGINAANVGDTVHVAKGTYLEVIDLGSLSCVLESDYADTARWGIVDSTIIDGSTNAGWTVVSVGTGQDTTCIINGFTIQGGTGSISNGGMAIVTCSPKVINCVITDNDCLDEGGGLRLYDSDGIFRNIIIHHNTAALGEDTPEWGGGLYVSDGSLATFENVLIYKNTVSTTDGGGGIAISSASPSFINCTIVQNKAVGQGEGILLVGTSSPSFVNCIIAFNEAISDPSSYHQIDDQGDGSPTFTYTNVYDPDGKYYNGGSLGTGCISTNPAFSDSANADYTLTNGSGSIGVGSNAAVNETTDLAGDTRIVNTVDMGCYETDQDDPSGWTGIIGGVTNPSVVGGVDVKNIFSVGGVE